MKAAISGVGGLIGAHTARAFLRHGATVIGFDNLSRRGCAESMVRPMAYRNVVIILPDADDHG
jgi:nucleoside-diphosphate-sugar epimerase